ncbi:hypothetical protein DSM104299_03834 [Baekduia alba]|uniref:hypothetical protein n=1 Tax=Baekduia alba TaxID=2997333 RepID=UPI0023418C18|nr:hypothetical protein [Baekduia alba]WCB95092.1 hypothetical protein DSM104299_03834 [Baekduia alba]
MSGEVVGRPPDDAPDEPRRRFRRRTDRMAETIGDPESIAAVHAELLLLREENARLKASQHQRADVSRLIGRARSLAAAELDRDSVSDDVEQLLVEGLLIRESLLEICQEVERAMVAFEGKLNALAALGAARSRPPATHADTDIEQGDGYGSRVV